MVPVLVRLPNWVGDVIMALPAVAHLAAHGYEPRLVGRRWAATLLAGLPWRVTARPGRLVDAVRVWRELRDDARAADPGFGQRANTLLLTNSFSSAAEARLAGLRPVGYRQDGRGWLLTTAVARPDGTRHESLRFRMLAAELTGHAPPDEAPVPALPVTGAAAASATALLAAQGIQAPFAVLVPFATGTLAGQSKAWPDFPAYARQLASRLPVIVVPGPGEVDSARRDYPQTHCLEDVDLAIYAALLQRASVVVANDTGPGHIAAAVGAPLVSVLGPTDAGRYRPLGAQVRLIQASPWPTIDAVAATVDATLATAR